MHKVFVTECISRTNLSKKSKFLQLLIIKIGIVMISKKCFFSKIKKFFFVSVKVILQILIPTSSKSLSILFYQVVGRYNTN